LRNEDLIGAHLEGADLVFAHLEGARLLFADLEGGQPRLRPPGGGQPERSQPQRAHLEGAVGLGLKRSADDANKRAASVTLAAPRSGAPRPARSYRYVSVRQTQIDVAGADQPLGYAHRVLFDPAGRGSPTWTPPG
jgi:hypothetical protein